MEEVWETVFHSTCLLLVPRPKEGVLSMGVSGADYPSRFYLVLNNLLCRNLQHTMPGLRRTQYVSIAICSCTSNIYVMSSTLWVPSHALEVVFVA